jgi:type 1 glutamine amidotransferase
MLARNGDYGPNLARNVRHQIKKPMRQLTITLTLTCLALASQLFAQPPIAQYNTRSVKILMVTGQDHPSHAWQQTAPALAESLRKNPRLKVTIIDDPEFLDSLALERYDVIMLHFMNWEQPAPGQKARENLRRVVAGGKGLVLVHFACGAFQDWPEFRNLAGRAWDPKLRSHDPRGLFRVEIANQYHSLVKGMKNFQVDDELYTCLAGDRPISILAKARSKVDGKDYPIAFVLNYEKGRVFHCVLGHDVKALATTGVVDLYRRGCLWVAGMEP